MRNLVKTKTLITSIISMALLIGLIANYAFAADVEVVEESIGFQETDFHFWEFEGTDGTSELTVTLVCGNSCDPST